MTAFLKIEDCCTCQRAIPWEWVPAVIVGNKALPGTGVWRSQLAEGRCPSCKAALEAQRQKERWDQLVSVRLIELLGGDKPYRELTFERYVVTDGNRRAYERCRHFNPAVENVYLWGSCGIGKTHLAYAAARHCFEETLSVAILPASQLSRKVRMKDPDQEQEVINDFIAQDVLILDDLGAGPDTAYSQQILQEILDGRDFRDRAGLIVTSSFSLDALAQKMRCDAIPSRLAGMCKVIQIRGQDHRSVRQSTTQQTERRHD